MNPIPSISLFRRLRAAASNFLILLPAIMLVALYVLGCVEPWMGG